MQDIWSSPINTRSSVAPAIRQLKQQGVRRTVMLTGDRESAARAVAQQIGVDTVVAQLLPQDKSSRLKSSCSSRQQERNWPLSAMASRCAGAGRADLGVAMGGMGSDAAIEAADIILMKMILPHWLRRSGFPARHIAFWCRTLSFLWR